MVGSFSPTFSVDIQEEPASLKSLGDLEWSYTQSPRCALGDSSESFHLVTFSFLVFQLFLLKAWKENWGLMREKNITRKKAVSTWFCVTATMVKYKRGHGRRYRKRLLVQESRNLVCWKQTRTDTWFMDHTQGYGSHERLYLPSVTNCSNYICTKCSHSRDSPRLITLGRECKKKWQLAFLMWFKHWCDS